MAFLMKAACRHR